jgi:hypothetical protein
MFGLFRPSMVYLKILPDQMEVTDVRTRKSLKKNAASPFSNSRMLIAENAEAVRLGQMLLP